MSQPFKAIRQFQDRRRDPLRTGGVVLDRIPSSVDRGYRGNAQIGPTKVQIPKPFNDKKQTRYQQKKLKKAHRRRAAIEPVIGHLKTDHRLGRNFYKGIFGDNINIMLAAAGFNFKRMMNKWKKSFFVILQNLIIQFNNYIINCIIKSNLAF
ncbi:transposase [Sphingobacterium sp. DR205]|uniref:transposase n=1 Tax=Sphingobacterium sp. DR205 TaxID=2713573 RepID=UPI0024078D06|nr:transposase [Sphingobacterium sp. DR205]